jgi:hypothetical protein
VADIDPTRREEVFTEVRSYAKRRGITLIPEEVNGVWRVVEAALGTYRGKSRDSSTPTVKDRNKRVKKTRILAAELVEALGFYDEPHIFGYINRHMMLLKGEAIELKNQLEILRDLPLEEGIRFEGPDGMVETRRISDNPKEDPYLDDLIYDLALIWKNVMGRPPGLTGINNYAQPPAPQRTGPFYRWVIAVLALSSVDPPSCRIVDNIVRHLKQNT